MLGERVESWVRRHESLVDAGSAVTLAACCVLIGIAVRADAAYYVFCLLLALPMAFRRRQPVGCAAVVLTVALVQWLTVRHSVALVPADLAVPWAVYALSAYGPLWSSRLGLTAGLAGSVLGGIAWPRLAHTASAHLVLGGFLASSVVAAWAFGTLHQVRRRQLATLAERARLLEIEREQRDRLASLAERTRIAREMHDVVAHSLAVLIAQADGGRYAKEPGAGDAALVTIGEHARQALAETRKILGVLRDAPAQDPEHPQPGIAELPALVERVRSGGLEVSLAVDDLQVDPGLGLVVYRIVQEGLTNVIKHARTPCRVEVSVYRRAGQVEVEVVNDGAATRAPTGAGGYGLLGMRERVAAYGGTMEAGPRVEGGFRVRARIPS